MLGKLQIIGITLFAALLAALAQYILKSSIKKFSFTPKGIIKMLANAPVLLGLLVYIISLVIYLYVLRSGELSFVYPIFASTFIFVVLISKFLLDEPVSRTRTAGILVIILGIVLVSLTY